MEWTRKDLLGLEELSKEEIIAILDTARSMAEVSERTVKKVPALRGKIVVTLFYEPSTRTNTSFTLAAKRLSADTVSFSKGTSSVTKGESLRDTAQNLEAMGIDIVIIRHPASGAPHLLAKALDASVVNGGDGAHEHPTQALLDLYTIRERYEDFSGLKVGIVGDIAHSRVAKSNIWGLKKLGADVVVAGPSTLMPPGITDLGVTVSYDIEKVMRECDVVNILRIQLERQGKKKPFPSLREYTKLFGVNIERLQKAKKDILIMAPGPINRSVEIAPAVADGDRSVILRQVTNGIAVRMAVLYLVAGGKQSDETAD